MDPIALARSAWEAGHVVEACRRCDAILARHPRDPEALALATKISLQHGERATTEDLARRALDAAPSTERYLRTAVALHEMGLGALSEAHFRRRVRRAKRNLDLRFRWAVFQMVTGRPDAALTEVDAILAVDPQVEVHALRAMLLRRLGRLDEAILGYQTALRTDPARVEWWTHVGEIRIEQRHYPEAMRAFRNALSAATRRGSDGPVIATLFLHLADCCARSNLIADAWMFSEKALSLAPESARVWWNDLHLLPIIYTEPGQPEQVRRRYVSRLDAMQDALPLRTPAQRAHAVAGIKSPFYLHYQGGNMRPLMERYGGLVHRIARAWQPSLVEPPPMPPTDGRLRIGFASWFFRRHTVAKLFGDWIRGLDRSRFEVFVYHLGREVDDTTRALQAAADGFRHLPHADGAAACRTIRQDRLHALIHPEVGMASPALLLAALRAAPVQAVAWGHPVTTGLPSIDLFLTSDRMEPEDGETQVTESLVRLPGLSITVSPPPPPSARTRADFGLPEAGPLFLVPQSLFKLLPSGDHVYARILERVPDGCIAFLRNSSPTVSGLFERRLHAACRDRGVEPTGRIHLLPKLEWRDYLALNQLSDVFLDGLTWSGGMTTLEALAMDLVPVTLPGDTMRARHTAAILEHLEVTDTIADSVDGYVDLAVRLATDRGWRRALQARLAAARPKLYDDPRVIPALEEALTTAITTAAGPLARSA